MPGDAQRRRAGFHRAELLQVLYEAVKKNPNIQMHVNKRLQKVEKVSDKEMNVIFQDGTSATANLVIGADGIHSVVRDSYIEDRPIFSGYVAYRGLIPMDKVREFWSYDDSDVSGFWTQQGKHFMTYTLHKTLTNCRYPISTNGSILNIVAFCSGHKFPPKKESWVSKAPKSEVFEVYKGWDPIVQKIIGLMDDEPGCWALYDRLPYKQWVFEDGKVVLMGDAAHVCVHTYCR
jgi:salicylate hydroxylase